MHDLDTICAVATPAGSGGIGIIRISGPDAVNIVSKIVRIRAGKDLKTVASHTLHYGHVMLPGSSLMVDEVIVSVMRAPATYTRENVVEINCHGGMVPLKRTMEILLEEGARLAEPGEFTKRAFLNGRIDLAQAESVMDIIRARTEQSHIAANALLDGRLSDEVKGIRERTISLLASVEASIDFSEEDIDIDQCGIDREIAAVQHDVHRMIKGGAYGRIIREGCAIAIVGRPNVGKSSLLNALLMQDRAIVTDIPGTTRDVLEESLNIDGYLFRILDTAGIRHAEDPIEREGVKRTRAAMQAADIVLLVIDGSVELTEDDRQILFHVREKSVITIVNKHDLRQKTDRGALLQPIVMMSCKTGEGLVELRKKLVEILNTTITGNPENLWSINQRHKFELEEAWSSLQKARNSLAAGLSPEFLALDIRDALDHIGSVVGATYTEDILEKIFSSFCIGK